MNEAGRAAIPKKNSGIIVFKRGIYFFDEYNKYILKIVCPGVNNIFSQTLWPDRAAPTPRRHGPAAADRTTDTPTFAFLFYWEYLRGNSNGGLTIFSSSSF